MSCYLHLCFLIIKHGTKPIVTGGAPPVRGWSEGSLFLLSCCVLISRVLQYSLDREAVMFGF
jgi:hypothetical protein